MVKVKVGDDLLISVSEGIGPVNALDLALRKDLGKYQGYITGLETSPIIACVSSMPAPKPSRRVLIESTDESGDHWTTIGVSLQHH